MYPGETRAIDPAGGSAADVEVGAVEWRRDLDAAIAESRRTGTPVFAFFQEVPGCSGCRSFGADVMSYQPIVDAIEHEFLPVLIYNNRPGKDAEVLARFNEPAWNYQVIRFLDGAGHDLIPRQDGVWTREALAARMIEALVAAKQPVPGYLEVVALEANTDRQATVAFAQSCFWSGEMLLGRVRGVITTEAGWIENREVTLVRYRPDLAPLDALVEAARTAGVADAVFVTNREQGEQLGGTRLEVAMMDGRYRRARDTDQKRQIQGSVFAGIELSPMQSTKVNAFVTSDVEAALSWLTPGQRAELEGRQTCR